MSERTGAPREAGQEDARFVPRGAIAFMVLMILVYGAVWLFFFRLLLRRS